MKADIAIPPLPRLPAALPRAGVSEEARAALRQLLGDHDRALAAAFRNGAQAVELAHLRAQLVERVLAHTWTAYLGEGAEAALFAVGGFGRGALFPHSDVDLLVLVEEPPSPQVTRALEAWFGCLWDIGLKPGHAVRTPGQCREIAAEDVSVFTSLLDARRVAGAQAFEAQLRALVADPALWPACAFLEAKRADRDARHARHDDTTHNLEPNLKDGPGGLRGLDLIRWLGARVAEAPDLDALVARQLLDPSERDALLGAERVLQRARYALHLEAGRAEERLLFDWQRALATRLGFQDDGRNLAVEQFMQTFYRAAGTVERLLSQLLERFEEFLHPLPAPQPLDEHFAARGTRLSLRDERLFAREPSAIVAAFACLLDHPQLRGFSAATMRALGQALVTQGNLDDDPRALSAFLALLKRGAGAVRALEAMNRHGVLAAILPAFARVVGRMQYDLFHIYTVDEHTLRVLRNVARFAEPSARTEFPLACEAYARLEKPELLLLAALFHDIAKGRGGDHSELGEAEARVFCAKLGLHEDDIDLVAWLVRWHLMMSVTAQRQDISDAEVVHAFAVQVGDWERLDHLYLLTIADIAGTSPKLWNSWKDRLLADLYVAARFVLRRELARPAQADTRMRASRERVAALLREQGRDPEVVRKLLDDFPDHAFLRQPDAQIAWQAGALLDAPEQQLVVAVHPSSPRGGTEVFVCAPDRDGVFASVVATLDRARCSVMEARVLATRGGRALDAFTVLDAENLAPLNDERARDLRASLLRALAPNARPAQPPRRGLARRLKHFQRAPQVDFQDAPEQARTRLALVCTDRPGLLAQVAQAFLESGVRVHDARIATFGERVEDFFELTDRRDLPLPPPVQERLRSALQRHLGGDTDELGSSHARA
ncbi:MAG TPA: [protein-PII] uridylyltransferase [Rhodanobacteraceae bacterium]|nr:[protein-PII] uridylyltransferase [Rhodanobacteraceae bacterium]